MQNWNPEVFKQACLNIKYYYLKNGKVDLPQCEDYNFSDISEVYSYIASVILEGGRTGEGVREWTKSRSNGPDRRTTDIFYNKIMNFLYGTKETQMQMMEDYNMLKTQYSDFTKQRVYEVHKSIMKYLLYIEEEDVFWEMENTLDENRVAIPEEVVNALQSFISQHLEVYLFGKRITKKCVSEIDISDMKKEELEEWQNPEFKELFQLRNMYEVLCNKYIVPILREE